MFFEENWPGRPAQSAKFPGICVSYYFIFPMVFNDVHVIRGQLFKKFIKKSVKSGFISPQVCTLNTIPNCYHKC